MAPAETQPAAAPVEPVAPAFTAPSSRARTRRAGRTDWRLGGRTVRPWRELTLAWACFSLGAGVLLGFVISTSWASPWASFTATAVLWVSMLVPIVWAFRRSRPVGLLKLRPIDLLYGLALGVALRIFQGVVAEMSGTGATFPTFTTFDGQLPALWWLTDAASSVLIAPVVEEFFFRGVILVALYSALRRPFGKLTAGLGAGLVSTALFIIVHTVSGAIAPDTAVSLAAVGATCALLVLLTGRLWGAVLVHIVFNTTYFVLGLVGTFAG
ncbi:hypothetical protein SAMN04487751_2890 [Microbacterium saccharophilum]|uniref:CAAX prenyl protease 2/Lysostaphin resistance protein A-like domain-containing protein n=2 Tax=Microbacteriaceae TaxID=85023 RepID=A0A7Z7GFC2_9MICO|nr:hypothetical protein SAMN04487751_2890 [Microbacterium saccharophilum]